MKTVLLLEPDNTIAQSMTRALREFEVLRASSATEAIELANDNNVDLVVVELSLGGHSGFEFLYEFRSYADWLQIPIIVFTHVKLQENVLESRSWKALGISTYLYKPSTSLAKLLSMVERATVNV